MLLTCVCIVLIVIFFTFLRYSIWRKKFCQNIPGTKPGFFNVFGDLAEVWKSVDEYQSLNDRIRKTLDMFKEEEIFCVWLLYKPIIVISKPNAVKDLLTGFKMNEKSELYSPLHYIVGTGLITSNGDKWKSRRRLLMPCFHPNMLRTFLTAFNEGAQKMVASLQEETKKDFSLIVNPIRLCTLGIIFETIFGVKMKSMEKEFLEYSHSFNRVTHIFMQIFFSPWLWPSILFWNSKTGKEWKYNCEVMQRLTRKVIREKREGYLRGETDTSQEKPKSLMDLLMQKHFETQEFSEEDIREEVNAFTVAGYETTTTSTVWALYLIGLYPDVQSKLREEIDEIFGNDVDRHVTERDLLDLQYLDCVIKETNRLYTTLPIYVRQSNEDTTICGYSIPKGTSCAVFAYFLHNDEDIFPEPDTFKPERFLPENSINIPNHAYIPFSAGPRKCIGYKFAEMEIKILVSSILRNFTIESLDERSKIRPLLKISLQPSTPIRIRIRPISSKKD